VRINAKFHSGTLMWTGPVDMVWFFIGYKHKYANTCVKRETIFDIIFLCHSNNKYPEIQRIEFQDIKIVYGINLMLTIDAAGSVSSRTPLLILKDLKSSGLTRLGFSKVLCAVISLDDRIFPLTWLSLKP